MGILYLYYTKFLLYFFSNNYMTLYCTLIFTFRIECTLFGIYVDELNVFLSSGEVQNVAVSIEFVKVKTFQGKILLLLLQSTLYYLFHVNLTYTIFLNIHKVQVQNCKFYTRIKYNVNFKEASELKSR